MEEGPYAIHRPEETAQMAGLFKDIETSRKRVRLSKANVQAPPGIPAAVENIKGNTRRIQAQLSRRMPTSRRRMGHVSSCTVASDEPHQPPGYSTQAVADILAKDLPEPQNAPTNKITACSEKPTVTRPGDEQAVQRFSLRQLSTHLERPLLVTKSAHMHPFQRTPSRRKSQCKKKAIPIPQVGRVPSPWSHEGLNRHKEGSFKSPHESLHAVRKLPTPWTKERVWDQGKTRLCLSPGENQSKQRKKSRDAQVIVAATCLPKAMEELLRHALKQLPGGYTYYEETCNKTQPKKITHLVVGEDRRTLKLMLAVAQGAILVSPEWVTASLEAGLWLPVMQYQANTRFLKASQEASRLVAEGKQLLSHHNIYVHVIHAPSEKKRITTTHTSTVRAVAKALGATLSRPEQCTLCIAVTAPGQPSSKSDSAYLTKLLGRQVPVVPEKWLYHAVESMEQPPIDSTI